MKPFGTWLVEAADYHKLLRGDYKSVLKSAHGLSSAEAFKHPDKMKNALDQVYNMHKGFHSREEFNQHIRTVFAKEMAHLQKTGHLKSKEK